MKKPVTSSQSRVRHCRSRRTFIVCLGMVLAASLIWFHFTGKRGTTPEARRSPGESTPVQIESPPAASVNPTLAAALGSNGEAGPAERLHLLRGMSGPLSVTDAAAALSSLLALPGEGTSPGWHAEYMHEICLMLRRCGAVGENFAQALITLSGDEDRPIIIRDYALQHLASIWADPEITGMRLAITDALHDLFRSGPPLASAALLALHRLGNTDAPPGAQDHAAAGVPDDRIEAMAADVLASASSDTATRMAAVRIIADRQFAGQRGTLRTIAANEAEPTVLRMAAVAAIGRFADPRDAAFIDSIPASQGSLLAGALRHAGESISKPAR